VLQLTDEIHRLIEVNNGLTVELHHTVNAPADQQDWLSPSRSANRGSAFDLSVSRR